MRKSDLVDAVAEQTGLSKKDAAAAVDAVIGAITCALTKHEAVQLTGFGTFKATERKAGTARNPQTGAIVQVPAKWVPRFTAGKSLKDAVAGK